MSWPLTCYITLNCSILFHLQNAGITGATTSGAEDQTQHFLHQMSSSSVPNTAERGLRAQTTPANSIQAGVFSLPGHYYKAIVAMSRASVCMRQLESAYQVCPVLSPCLWGLMAYLWPSQPRFSKTSFGTTNTETQGGGSYLDSPSGSIHKS